MFNEKFLKDLGRLGFPLFEPAGPLDSNETLAAVVNSRNARLWEGFPVLLANAFKQTDFNFDKFSGYVDSGCKDDARKLLALALSFLKSYHLESVHTKALLKNLGSKGKGEYDLYKTALSRGNEYVAVLGQRLRRAKMEEYVRDLLRREETKTQDNLREREELSLEYSLSQLFSPKQKELFKKKLNGAPLTKTEREYFSRTVKKKVQALANAGLHSLARRLLE